MTKRMLAAMLSLVGFFVALYLTLFKLGALGGLACVVGSCEAVQLSMWSELFGIPVAAWGLAFYLVTFVVAIVGVQQRFADTRPISVALTALTGWGVLFSLWLTYLELFVIDAICLWCVVSAVIVAVLFAVSVLDLREVRRLERGG